MELQDTQDRAAAKTAADETPHGCACGPDCTCGPNCACETGQCAPTCACTTSGRRR